MADFSSFFIGPGGDGGPDYNQVSPLSDQGFNELYGATRSLIPTQLPSILDMVNTGVNSPLIQAILGPALARLMGTEQASRDAVTDAARATGGLRGTAYMQGLNRNEQNLMQNRSNLISDVIAKNLGTLLSGQLQEQKNMMMPGEEYMNLLKLIRPDVVTGRGGAVGGGMGSSGGPSFGFTPSIFDPGYDAMMADWQRRMNPSYSGSPGMTGVNYKPNPLPVAQPYYDPYQTNQPLPLNNYSNISNPYTAPNPQDYISYGPWTDANREQDYF